MKNDLESLPPKRIYLTEYTAPAFRVKSLDLHFTLHETATQVTAIQIIEKISDAPLVLDGEALVFAADSAMYKAKRDRSGFHASELPARPEHKNIHSIYGGLQREFDPERFLVHYQPLINLKTSEIVGVE